jgi:hypothetical protein
MALCLLGRDRPTGSVRALLAVSFDRLDDAVEAARSLVIDGSVDPDATDVLVVDLSHASRLLVVRIPTAAPVEPEIASEQLPAAAGAWEAPIEAVADEPDTTKAAPVAIAVEPGPAPLDVKLPASAEWPIDPAIGTEPDLESPVEEAAAPGPVRAEPEAETDEPELEDVVEVEPAADGSHVLEPVVVADVVTVVELPLIELVSGPYEVSGELVLERYTCDDCVYANTCPKVGESAPAECGSFQWKAL